MSFRVCLVEDDPTIREFVGERLRKEGFSVDEFDAAEPLMQKSSLDTDWDLYIVDIQLAGRINGLHLCRRLREFSPTIPVLVLSAFAEPNDRIEGLKAGADDYLTKPFETEELVLRVNGMLKRRSWYRTMPDVGAVFRWGENEVDFSKMNGRRGKDTFELSSKECMILKLLVEREGQVVSRDEILNQVWGYDVFPSSRTVDNFILRLRKHFEANSKEPKHIHSVRGTGYRFTK